MDRFIGLDAHTASCTLAVVGPSGRRLRSEVVETQAAPLRAFVSSLPGRKFLCMEEGMHSEWLYEVLEPVVDELVVTQPLPTLGSKSDARDAWKRADELRRGHVQRVIYKSPRAMTELRQAVKVYLTTRSDLRRCKARLKIFFGSRGMVPPSSEIYGQDDREVWIDKLPPSHRRRAEILGASIDASAVMHQQAEQWMLQQARQTSAVRWVSSVPGLGKRRAPIAVATMISPHRFRTKRQLWHYSGLAVVTRSSADWVRQDHGWARQHVAQTRGLNRNRNPILKDVFVGAAERVIRLAGHPLQQRFQQQLEQGTKPNLARLTLARKIAAITLAVWKNQEVYDPDKLQPTSTASPTT